MTRITRRGLLPLAVFAVAALFALCLAAVAGSAGAEPATQSKLRTGTYRGASSNDHGAKLLVRAQVTGKGIPSKVTLLKVTGGTMQCLLGPSNKWSPVELNWAWSEYAIPVTLEENAKGRKTRSFEAVQTNGGAPTEGEEEEFEITGGFTLNGKSAHVSINREFVTKGSAVGSDEELVSCKYYGAFRVHLAHKR
jgi:hypothetical protein